MVTPSRHRRDVQFHAGRDGRRLPVRQLPDPKHELDALDVELEERLGLLVATTQLDELGRGFGPITAVPRRHLCAEGVHDAAERRRLPNITLDLTSCKASRQERVLAHDLLDAHVVIERHAVEGVVLGLRVVAHDVEEGRLEQLSERRDARLRRVEPVALNLRRSHRVDGVGRVKFDLTRPLYLHFDVSPNLLKAGI